MIRPGSSGKSQGTRGEAGRHWGKGEVRAPSAVKGPSPFMGGGAQGKRMLWVRPRLPVRGGVRQRSKTPAPSMDSSSLFCFSLLAKCTHFKGIAQYGLTHVCPTDPQPRRLPRGRPSQYHPKANTAVASVTEDRSTGQVNKGHLVTNTYTLLMFIFSQETNLFFKGLS